jgi:Zn-dependent peptidase ImmA (M78 family)
MSAKNSLQKIYTDHWEYQANKVLSHFNIHYPNEIDMYDICWKYGIQIKPLDEDFLNGEITEEIKSFSIPKKKSRKGIIYIKPDLDPVEKRIILAEEFCHVYAHYTSQLQVDKYCLAKTENQAKRMAAYLLMPWHFLKSVMNLAYEEPVLISEIADYFLVTEEFARYRLELIYNRRIDILLSYKGKLGSIEWFE